MWIIDFIGFAFDGIPILRRLWRWLWEREMELELREPQSQIVRGANGLNIPPSAKPLITVYVGKNPHIYIWLDLVLTNHRTNIREVIIDCELHLKKKRFHFWETTITSAKVLQESNDRRREHTAWKPVILEPMSSPTLKTVYVLKDIDYPVRMLPKKMSLVLEFKMVGPHRHIRRVLENFRHDPTQVPDILG